MALSQALTAINIYKIGRLVGTRQAGGKNEATYKTQAIIILDIKIANPTSR
jgi:hypothetical protein